MNTWRVVLCYDEEIAAPNENTSKISESSKLKMAYDAWLLLTIECGTSTIINDTSTYSSLCLWACVLNSRKFDVKIGMGFGMLVSARLLPTLQSLTNIDQLINFSSPHYSASEHASSSKRMQSLHLDPFCNVLSELGTVQNERINKVSIASVM